MTCLTFMSILCGAVRAVFSVGAQRLLRRPMDLRPFPCIPTVLGLVRLVLGSMLKGITDGGWLIRVLLAATLSALLRMPSLDESLFDNLYNVDSCDSCGYCSVPDEVLLLLLLRCEGKSSSLAITGRFFARRCYVVSAAVHVFTTTTACAWERVFADAKLRSRNIGLVAVDLRVCRVWRYRQCFT
jgi:hypothetical protein